MVLGFYRGVLLAFKQKFTPVAEPSLAFLEGVCNHYLVLLLELTFSGHFSCALFRHWFVRLNKRWTAPHGRCGCIP